MSEFMAVTGSINSGLMAHDKAIEWAKAQLENKPLSNKGNPSKVFICELVAIAEYAHPPIKITSVKEEAELELPLGNGEVNTKTTVLPPEQMIA